MIRVRRSIPLLAALLLALVVLVPASAEMRAGSKYGGTLVVGLLTEPDALDPILGSGVAALEVYRTFCQKLYDLDSKGNVVPQLAAAMPAISKDKLTYTIPLRKGVVFNDGTPFNADAVVQTIERGKTDPLSSRVSDLAPIKSVTAAGPYTVVIHLEEPYAALMIVLNMAGTAVVSPTQLAKLGDSFSTDPVCVGPFMFDDRVAGDRITVIKSPYYFDRNRVYLDKIVFKIIRDPAAAAAALKAGDIQALDVLSPNEVAGVTQAANLRVLRTDSYGWSAIRINIGNRNGEGNPPYSNVGTPLASSTKLRKAFEHAIDRKTLTKVVFGGLARPGCKPVTPASPWFDATVKCTPYDPAEAKRLVAASGVRDPTVHLLAGGSTDSQRLAQFIQAEEAEVGIKVVIDRVAGGETSSGRYDAALVNWSGISDPDGNIYRFLATSGATNSSGYSNPRLDLILENGRKALNDKARRTLYRAAQQIILEDRPYIYLYYPIRYVGVSTQVSGVQLFPDTQIRVAFAQLK